MARMIRKASRIERFLDMGCGPAVLFPDALERCTTYFAADIAPANLASIERQDPKIRPLNRDFDSFTWAKAYFDVVVCSGSLEYADGGLASLNRLLATIRHDGMFIGSFPNFCSPYRMWHEFVYLPVSRTVKRLVNRRHAPYYRTLFSQRRVQDLLASRGFGEVGIEHVGYNVILPPVDSWFPRVAYGAEFTLRRTMPRKFAPLASEFIVSARRTT